MADSMPLERKGQSNDFEKAKQLANKLFKTFAQVEVVEALTNECVYFLSKDDK